MSLGESTPNGSILGDSPKQQASESFRCLPFFIIIDASWQQGKPQVQYERVINYHGHLSRRNFAVLYLREWRSIASAFLVCFLLAVCVFINYKM